VRNATEQFGPVAEAYLTSSVHSNEADLARCVKLVRPKGGPVVDIGCGAGHTTFAFAPVCERVVAVDPTPEMLRIVDRESKAYGLNNVETLLATAESMPLNSGSFEGATCRLAAHHFLNTNAFLVETARVLRPGGWLLLVDTIGIEDPEADEELDRIERQRDPSHVMCLTLDRWNELMQNSGFEIRHCESHAFPQNAVHWLDRMKVEEPARSSVLAQIANSKGWLREYFRPTGEGDLLTFRLHQGTIVAVRR